jgi:hypothetical protein
MKNYLAGLAIVWSGFAYSTVYYSELVKEYDLGKSFDLSIHQLGTHCLQGKVIYHKDLSGSLDYFQRVDQRLIRRRTFGEVHGGINLFIIAGSVSTSINHVNATDNLTLTSQLHLKLDQGYSTLESRSLRPNKSIEHCGRQFVYQINYGRDLFINTRLHFRSEEDYKRFVTKIKIRLLFFKKTITKIKEIEKYAEHAVFSVDVNSNGALPVELQQKLDGQPRYCKGSEITPCLETLQSLVSYSFDEQGLIKDLSSLEKVPRSFVVKGLRDSGHYGAKDWLQLSTPNYELVWRAIDEQFGDALRNLERTKAFYSVASAEDKTAAELALQQAELVLEEITFKRDECFAHPWMAMCQ